MAVNFQIRYVIVSNSGQGWSLSDTHIPLIVGNVLQQRRKRRAVHSLRAPFDTKVEYGFGNTADPPRPFLMIILEYIVSILPSDSVLAYEDLVIQVLFVKQSEVSYCAVRVLKNTSDLVYSI